MTNTAEDSKDAKSAEDGKDPKDAENANKQGTGAPFILYLDGNEHREALQGLTLWVHHLLLPVYARETTTTTPWCPRWWEHQEAVAQLYGLWMAWQELTDPRAGMTGPAMWHRDYLNHVMASLRDANGPFAGCKPGSHRPKERPQVDN